MNSAGGVCQADLSDCRITRQVRSTRPELPARPAPEINAERRHWERVITRGPSRITGSVLQVSVIAAMLPMTFTRTGLKPVLRVKIETPQTRGNGWMMLP